MDTTLIQNRPQFVQQLGYVRIIDGELPGILIIEPNMYRDARGYFLETYNLRKYRELGIEVDFVQDNLSFSRRGVLRGLHYQNPCPQAKLVSVLAGEVYDVVVDLRRASPTFGRWQAIRLDGDSKRQCYVPPGFAHGFQVLSETALFYYKCSAFYAPRCEVTVRWDDPQLGIEWPLPDPILSPKDASAPFLRDLPIEKLFP